MKSRPQSHPSATAEHDPLIFVWPERNASFVLPVFFLLALLCHAAAFYLFQIVYPPSSAVAPPTGQLLYIAPDSPENIALLQWIDAQTPAAVARLRDTPLPKELHPIAYTPSYLTPSTLPKGASLTPPPPAYPAAYPLHEKAAPLSPPKAQAPVPSSLAFSSSLTPFHNSHPPALFPPPTDANPEPIAHPPHHSVRSLQKTELLVALNRRGELRYTFAQASSGDKSLDRLAAAHLQSYPFTHPATPPDEEYTWGTATFIWGNDAYEYQEPAIPPSLSVTP